MFSCLVKMSQDDEQTTQCKYHSAEPSVTPGYERNNLDLAIKCTQPTLADYILYNLDTEMEHLHKLPSLMDCKFSYSTFGCGSTCHFDAISYLKHFFSLFFETALLQVTFIYVLFCIRFFLSSPVLYVKFAAGRSPNCVKISSHVRQLVPKTLQEN